MTDQARRMEEVARQGAVAPDRAAQARARFGRPELAPLWSALRDRLERSAGPVRRVRVGPLSPQQRVALADLLGLDRLPGEAPTVPVERLDVVLLQSPVCLDSRGVVEAIGGPLRDRTAERRADEATRADLWAWVAGHPVVRAEPALSAWVQYVRGSGLVGGSVAATRELVGRALAVLGRLPGDGGPLPAFADQACGDPHALDDGRRLATYVLRALACLHDEPPPATAAERRALWERAGIECDALSTSVLVAGLRPTGDGPLALTARAWAALGQAVRLTLAQLRADPLTGPAGSLTGPAAPHVWIVENPSLIAKALDRLGPRCPPLVCTSGWPNTAVVELLRRLRSSGAELWCHADLDGDGLRITAYMAAKTGARPWRMTTSDYLTAILEAAPPEAGIPETGGPETGPAPGRLTDVPWDPDLATALRAHRMAVPEERVADLLLDDLALGMPPDSAPAPS
jgi:uncharacterized protein (TIGR02679 family)